jgi:hypothetical protein
MKPLVLISLANLIFSHLIWADPGKDISDLPGHIAIPASGFALVADFAHASAGTIPVYFINRSGKDIQLAAQDGDVYLKLEYQDADGSWKRAQPHAYSWCGNSYFESPVIRSDQFVAIKGYQPLQGDSRKIRFRLYRQQIEVASNVGQGLVHRGDIQKAQNDAMAVSSGDLAFVEAVARGKRVLHNTMDHIKDLREYAIFQLGSGRFDRAKVEKVLRDIVNLKEQPYAGLAQGQLNGLKYRAEHPE